MKIFSERLKELRLEHQLTAKQLSRQIGVSDSIIIRWEHGERQPTIDNLYKLAVFFKVSADYLLGLEN